MKRRIIFELDDTLIHGSMFVSREFFERMYGDESFRITNNLEGILSKYEGTHTVCDYNLLSKYLSSVTGLDITPEVIMNWDTYLGNADYYVDCDVLRFLNDMKAEGISLAVLTNWFRDTQIKKMERFDLIGFFDDIYTGEGIIKPHKGAYTNSLGSYDKKDILFVGNDLKKDYIVPRCMGIDSVLYDRFDTQHSSVVKVKKIDELRKVVK